MTKRNKLILISSIVAVVVVVLTTILVLWLNKDNWSPVTPSTDTEQGDNTVTPTPEDVVTYDMRLLYGLKEEYYVGEELDVEDIAFNYNTYVNGAITSSVKVDCTTGNIKRDFYDDKLPDTNTVGTHSFTIAYLQAELVCFYNVVEYAEKHHVGILADNIYISNNSVLSTLYNANITGNADTFVNETYNKLLGSNNGLAGPLRYLNHIDNLLDNCNIVGGIDNYNHPTNANLVAYINNTSGTLTGKFYVTEQNETQEISFELNFYKQNKGFKLIINAHGNTYTILSNSSDTITNMVVKGVDVNDVAISFTPTTYYLALVTANQNDELYANIASSTFANSGIKHIAWNIQNKTYTYLEQ